MARGFEELNLLNNRSIPFETYFGEMEITEEQKEKRIAFAEDLEELILFLFALTLTMVEYDSLDKDYILIQLSQKYLYIAGKYIDVDEYTEKYVSQFSSTFLQTTLDNIEDEWYSSPDRAAFIAENESNNVVSHDEYVKAVKSGKKKKQWITMRDKRVRHTHMVLEGKTIGIGETFKVGNGFMNFPRDEEFSPDPREVISCRCSIKYF